MKGWEIVTIKEITNNLDNKRIPLNSSQRAKKESQPLYPYIGANNIMGYIDEYIFDEKILCLAEDGGSWGYNQKCAVIYNEKVWVNNHAHVLSAKESLILEYLMYYLNFTDLNLYINGATRGKLTQSALNSIQIPLPPLPTQQKIAAILDAADTLRQKDKALLAKYDELTQSLFLDMFGDPVKNEKGWEKKELGEVCILQGGFSFKSTDFVKSGVKLVKIANVHFEKLDWSDSDMLPVNFLERHPNFVLKEGDILMALTRPIIKSLGTVKAVTIQSSDLPALLNQRVARFFPDPKFLTKEFLLRIIYSEYFKNKIDKYSSTSLQPNVSNRQVESVEILLPPIYLQNQFAERVTIIEQQKAIAQASLDKSEELFNSLLQKAFKGELV
jgi:type I restriction enzyme, S subunit